MPDIGPKSPKPPSHLSNASKRWWKEVVATYALEPHHLKLLQLAAESWDRCQQGRRAIGIEGPFVADRYGARAPHPAIRVERDSRQDFARLLRQLDLDSEPGAAVVSIRPPSRRRS